MNDNKREQRCIELFDRLKQQFIRAHALDDADKGYCPNQSSKEFYHGLSAQEASRCSSPNSSPLSPITRSSSSPTPMNPAKPSPPGPRSPNKPVSSTPSSTPSASPISWNDSPLLLKNPAKSTSSIIYTKPAIQREQYHARMNIVERKQTRPKVNTNLTNLTNK